MKETLASLLKVLVKEKHPFKSEADIQKSVDRVMGSTIDEWMWRKIIEKMYDAKDYEILESRFLLAIEEKKAALRMRGKGAN